MREKIKSINFSENIHKVYLFLAIFFGLIFSVAMPFFNEPDGQYHFVASSSLVGLTTDISRYGEPTISTGMTNQQPSYKDGTRFEKYYLTKINIISNKDLPRNVNLKVTTYDFWGHVIPGVGVWLGYHIYPSMGVMITVGRMFSVFVYSLIMCLIIKRMKRGKELAALLMLSPVSLNQFASLSYDPTGYLVAIGVIATAINIITRKRFTHRDLIVGVLWGLLTIIATKQNIWFMLAIYPVVFLAVESRLRNVIVASFHKIWGLLNKNKWILSIASMIGIVGFLLVISLMTLKYGGPVYVLRRFVMTFVYRYSTGPTVGDIVISWLASPYPAYSRMPYWTVCVWYLIVFLVAFSGKKYVQYKTVSYAALIILVLGIVGTYYGFLNFGSGTSSVIEGVQGRYFTPTLLLLSIWGGCKRFKLRINSDNIILLSSLFIVFLTNSMLIFNTLVGLIVG